MNLFNLQRVVRAEVGPVSANFGALPRNSPKQGAEIALTKTADASLDELQGCPIILYLEDEALTLQGAITQWSIPKRSFQKIYGEIC